MPFDRRAFLTAAAAATLAPQIARAAPLPSALGRNAADYGVRANSEANQTRALQRAIDDAARHNAPLALAPGIYRTAKLILPAGARLVGAGLATRLKLADGDALLQGNGDDIALTDLTLDGGGRPLPPRRGLIHLTQARNLRIADCRFENTGGNGLWLDGCSGTLRGSTFTGIGKSAVVSFDGAGLLVAQNVIMDAADNGIEILRNSIGDDGTQVLDNRIENISAGPGGSGQHGNAVVAFRAGNVIVRGNRIRNCDYSAVRGNSAANIQIAGNSVFDVREVALYSEFAFQGAVIAHNTVDGAAMGVAIANFNEGGRLCVVHGNLIRNLLPKRPPATAPDDDAGVGIGVEADTAVTGNVIENAPRIGILAGWGKYLRDVTITGNVIRDAPIGIGVSVVDGAGTALVGNNLISGARRAAVAGFDHALPVTGDLTREGAARLPQAVLHGNVVR
ncbi:MAG: TIGR03808 family TAT-translocated repetitive protein [Xanthobacteraceae bacterium]